MKSKDSKCTEPIFICQIETPYPNTVDGIISIKNNLGEQKRPKFKVTFSNKLFAQFFENENDFHLGMSPFDLEISTPKKIMSDNGYAHLYDEIFSRMKYMSGEEVEKYPEGAIRENYLEFVRKMQTEQNKEDFIKSYVRNMINFEELRPQVKKFIDKYFQENPHYKYARIFVEEIERQDIAIEIKHKP